MEELPKDPLDLALSFIPVDPEKALREILPEMCILELAAVSRPSAAQLQAVRAYDPYTTIGLSEIKRQMVDGQVRFGPQHRMVLEGLLGPSLRSVGLSVAIRQATRAELKAAKMLDDDLPEYFRRSPHVEEGDPGQQGA